VKPLQLVLRVMATPICFVAGTVMFVMACLTAIPMFALMGMMRSGEFDFTEFASIREMSWQVISFPWGSDDV
jgi:hypothetical protein